MNIVHSEYWTWNEECEEEVAWKRYFVEHDVFAYVTYEGNGQFGFEIEVDGEEVHTEAGWEMDGWEDYNSVDQMVADMVSEMSYAWSTWQNN